MPSYILRNIDPKLWDKVKARALKDAKANGQDQISLKQIILALLALYADGKVNVKVTAGHS